MLLNWLRLLLLIFCTLTLFRRVQKHYYILNLKYFEYLYLLSKKLSLHYNLAGDIVNASPSLPEGIILKPPPLIEKKTPGRFRPNMVRIRWLHCYALIGIGKCIKIRYFKIWNKSKPWKKRSMNSLTWEAATGEVP